MWKLARAHTFISFSKIDLEEQMGSRLLEIVGLSLWLASVPLGLARAEQPSQNEDVKFIKDALAECKKTMASGRGVDSTPYCACVASSKLNQKLLPAPKDKPANDMDEAFKKMSFAETEMACFLAFNHDK
jgi:hypothetical protein